METVHAAHSRLRVDGLEHVATPDGSGRVFVRLERKGEWFEGTVECLQTQQGVIKAASRAALIATLARTGSISTEPVTLEVVGVKAVRAFDGWVVVTRLNGHSGAEGCRLLVRRRARTETICRRRRSGWSSTPATASSSSASRADPGQRLVPSESPVSPLSSASRDPGRRSYRCHNPGRTGMKTTAKGRAALITEYTGTPS